MSDNRVLDEVSRLRLAVASIEAKIASLEAERAESPSVAVGLVVDRQLAYQRGRLSSTQASLQRLEEAIAEDRKRNPELPF